MNRLPRLYLLALGLGLSLAGADQFTTIDYPGATATAARGINDAGDIAGLYTAGGRTRGFLLAGNKFTEIDFPDAKNTMPYGISSRGDVVGEYVDADNKGHGFLLSKGVFTSLDYPGADYTGAYSINSSGDIVGHTTMPGKPMHGFLLSRGAWTTFEYRTETPSRTMSCSWGINDAGVMVGHWATRGTRHGLIYNKGTFTEVDYGGGGFTNPMTINNSGDIAGSVSDAGQGSHGFLLRNGRFTRIDFPGARGTSVFGINNSGQIAGSYTDSGGRQHGYVTRVTPAGTPPPVLTVDDDGVDCPGALRTIQEAVAQAAPGSTILVCPGTYRKTVNIAGPEKNGLRLIATGREDEVALQGDYAERDGFHLENVINVLIRGFTVRDFGNKATTATEWGVGNQIYLMNAHYNTIEHNSLINGDMMGITLVDSGNNTVQNNFAWVNNSALANCGIHVEGAKSANNTIRLNMTWGNKMAGIMIRGAGPGNRVLDNTVLANGRFGIDVENTDEIWIEGNRVSYNRGFWGTSPGGQEPGLGINLVNVNKATVFDNRARNNSGGDLSWDGKGENKLESNACESSTPVGACGR